MRWAKGNRRQKPSVNFTLAALIQRALFSLLLFIFFFASVPLCQGQSLPRDPERSATNSTWRRFTGKNEEFSVLMPGEPSLYLGFITNNSGKRTLERIYSSYSQGSVYLIISYDGSSIKGTLENLKAQEFHQS